MPRQRQQPQDVLAAAVAEKAETLARTIGRRADADVIQVAEPKPVDRETAREQLRKLGSLLGVT